MPTLPLPHDHGPRCHATKLRAGNLSCLGEGYGVVFNPEGAKFWSTLFSAGLHVESAARACLDCGFIWAETDAKELAKFVATKCTPAAKARE
jgi:hypothetical protein